MYHPLSMATPRGRSPRSFVTVPVRPELPAEDLEDFTAWSCLGWAENVNQTSLWDLAVGVAFCLDFFWVSQWCLCAFTVQCFSCQITMNKGVFHGGRSSPTVVAQTINKLNRVVGQTDHADGNSLLPWGHRVFQGLESRLPFDACKISSVSHELLRF